MKTNSICTVTSKITFMYACMHVCVYAHLVLCLEQSRAFPFFVNFTDSPTTSGATDELASIVYKPSDHQLLFSKKLHLRKRIYPNLFLKYEIMSTTATAGCVREQQQNFPLHDDSFPSII